MREWELICLILDNLKVGVVIVTYNRLSKLKKAIEAYNSQKLLPDFIVVVNNNSSDGTKEFLEDLIKRNNLFDIHIINLEENIGGSGGFYIGQKKALELEADWIMIADDDAYPEENYIKGIIDYVEENNDKNLAVCCGKVIEDGRQVNVHRRFLKSKWKRKFYINVPLEFYQKKVFNVDFVSYVGILINKEKLIKAGLVEKDFFIWNDDVEHSIRLQQQGEIVCIPEFTIVHDVESENYQFSWKDYYGWRNNICIFKKHFKMQYYIVVLIAIIRELSRLIRRKRVKEVKLRLSAIKDGICGNLGKHQVYKPGWKP